MQRLRIVGELFSMVVRRGAWFLLPPIVALILIAALGLVGQVTPLGPLVYPLF